MSADLLPCPFCGNEVDGVLDVNEGVAFTPWYVVACHRCDFNVFGAREIADAIALWNQRAPVSSETPVVSSSIRAAKVGGYFDALVDEYVAAEGRTPVAGALDGFRVEAERRYAGVSAETVSDALDVFERAWGIIANVSQSDWSLQNAEWRNAAERFRDDYHRALANKPDDPQQALIAKQAERLSIRARQVGNLRRNIRQLQAAHRLNLAAHELTIHRDMRRRDELDSTRASLAKAQLEISALRADLSSCRSALTAATEAVRKVGACATCNGSGGPQCSSHDRQYCPASCGCNRPHCYACEGDGLTASTRQILKSLAALAPGSVSAFDVELAKARPHLEASAREIRASENAPSLVLCGASGALTDEARAELEEFATHLQNHPRGVQVAGCRPCAKRKGTWARSVSDTRPTQPEEK